MKQNYKISIILTIVFALNSNLFSQTNGWYLLSSGTANNLYGVSFTTANTGTVCGLTGTILRTTNGGVNWTPQTAPGAATHLFDVYFFNNNTGWIIGDVGKIIKTTNGGALWTLQNSGTAFQLQSLWFLDSLNGFVAGWYGTILKTTNGGTNWVTLNSGTQRNLNGIHFINPSTGYAVGLVGKVIKTTNGGTSWDSIIVGTSYALESVFFNGGTYGNIVGENGTVYKTSNSGVNWTTINFGNGNWLEDLGAAKQNLNICTTVGQAGTIRRTTNGGTNWYAQVSNTGFWLSQVSFSDTNNGFSVGDNGTILHTTTGGWLPPPAPGLVSPANNSNCFSLTGTLTWNDVAAPVATSQIRIATDVNFNNIVFDAGLIYNTVSGTTSFVIPGGTLQNNTIYYWHVKDSNQVAPGPWSVTWSFRTTLLAPSAPNLSAPPNNAIQVPLNALLSWDSVANATVYRVRVATDVNFSNVVFDSSNITTHSVTVPNGKLQINTLYYWRVIASNSCITGPNSATWSFTTIQPLGVVISSGEIPKVYKLYDNYPNPFNPSTLIKFDIPFSSNVDISVYDVTGKESARIISQKLEAGSYTYLWNAENFPSGVYFYTIRAEKFYSTKKMVLIK